MCCARCSSGECLTPGGKAVAGKFRGDSNPPVSKRARRPVHHPKSDEAGRREKIDSGENREKTDHAQRKSLTAGLKQEKRPFTEADACGEKQNYAQRPRAKPWLAHCGHVMTTSFRWAVPKTWPATTVAAIYHNFRLNGETDLQLPSRLRPHHV